MIQYAHFIAMQTYELLYILPGTLTEDEAKPIMTRVTDALTAVGVTDLTFEHGSKHRLSYPMQHIRYGWFELAYFSAEPTVVQALEPKLRVMPELLRVVVRLHPVGAARHLQNAFVPITRDQGRFDGERRDTLAPAMPSTSARPVEPMIAASTVPVETKVETGQLEDITKKLDEILEKDIANT